MTNSIVHLPLIAEVQSEVVGFLKAIYVNDLNYIFIAYLVSKNFNNLDSSRITGEILNKFHACIKNIEGIKYVIYEIVEEEQNKHTAKERLFKHRAIAKDLKSKYIDALYIIPEVCSFDEGNCNFYKSKLFFLDLNNEVSLITKHQYLKLIDSIYENIYTESYRLSEPELVSKHIDFVELIKVEISQKVKETIYLK